MTTQTWSSEGYDKNARFVTDLGAPVLELLAPKPGEHILDVGCGDGVLPEGDRADYLECVRDRIKPDLRDATGKWTADYVRLRFAAHSTHLTE